jgi:hypothetical protein
MKKKSEQLVWLQTQIDKDNKDLDRDKLSFISEIKKHKKEDILPQKPKKISLWKRILKALLG